MTQKTTRLSRHYASALQTYLKDGKTARAQPALNLGRRALALGFDTLEIARIHEQALLTLRLHAGPRPQLKRAGTFFDEVLTPIIETHRASRQNRTDLTRLNQILSRRTHELAASNRQLQRGILRRKSVEAALKRSTEHYTKLLRESLRLQQGLRRLTRQVIEAREDERKKISSDLQDQIAQTLLGINVRLVSLKREARLNTRGLKNEIASTQRLVAKSARSVRRVAREFRRA